jgi:hypothetical protein
LLALAGWESLGVTLQLPGGYARAVVIVPIVLMVPGSLTLGVIFGQRRRPGGVAFVCLSVLLSVLWLGFASLALSRFRVLITAVSLYWCLFVICGVLAIVAQARLMTDHRATRGARSLPQTPPDSRPPAATRGAVLYPVAAVLAGFALLAGGVHLQESLPRPAPAGYTWMAWKYPEGTADFVIGSAGSKLPFTIVHRQAGTATFRLTAAWQGQPSRSLANPLTLRLRPGQTLHGALFVPPLPAGCTNRVVLTLTATGQVDPLTKKPPAWSVNAGVHGPGKPRKTCQL